MVREVWLREDALHHCIDAFSLRGQRRLQDLVDMVAQWS
jgi:hypothetical protein